MMKLLIAQKWKMFIVALLDDDNEEIYETEIAGADCKSVFDLLAICLDGYYEEIRTSREYYFTASKTSVTLRDEDGDEVFETKKPFDKNRTVSELLDEVIEEYIEDLETREYSILVTGLKN